MSYYRRRNAERVEHQSRLNINEEDELKDWTERYGVSADKIREAVRTVGDQVSDVVKYLLDGNKSRQFSNR